jgi:GNAT superfamily N-acetyltransferase
MHRDDFPAADTLRRLAFGTFLGLPDPLSFRGDEAPDWTRFLTNPEGSFVAELDGELVGANFAVNWGSVGLLGPVAVHPDLWNRGVAQLLIAPALDAFDRWGTQHAALFTFGHSPKHVALYQKFGFWPRFPTVIMAKPVASSGPRPSWTAYASLDPAQQRSCLEQCRALTDSVYSGLDLSLEIKAATEQQLGETLLLWGDDQLDGFAVCHCGPSTEAGNDCCYVKFGAARPGIGAEERFVRLIAACEALTAERGLSRLTAGVNTARREAYRRMLTLGFRTQVQGLAMDRPDEPGYNQPGVYVIDDWR